MFLYLLFGSTCLKDVDHRQFFLTNFSLLAIPLKNSKSLTLKIDLFTYLYDKTMARALEIFLLISQLPIIRWFGIQMTVFWFLVWRDFIQTADGIFYLKRSFFLCLIRSDLSLWEYLWATATVQIAVFLRKGDRGQGRWHNVNDAVTS